MKLTFLGTSAGESYPAIWCDCPNCTYARQHGGRNLRMNTGSMIDDDVLLDLNSCTFYTAAKLGVSLTGVTTLLVTHPHSDHLTYEPLAWRFAKRDNEGLDMEEARTRGIVGPRFTPLPTLNIYGNAHVKNFLVDEHGDLFDEAKNGHMAFTEIEFGKRYVLQNLAFIPVEALHGEKGLANSYILERDGKRLLYALDTGGFETEMLKIIHSYSYDAVVMEGTFGLSRIERYIGHQTLDKNKAFRSELIEKGCIRPDTPFYLTHLGPHWTPPYDLYAPLAAKEGFTVAYDGLTIEI